MAWVIAMILTYHMRIRSTESTDSGGTSDEPSSFPADHTAEHTGPMVQTESERPVSPVVVQVDHPAHAQRLIYVDGPTRRLRGGSTSNVGVIRWDILQYGLQFLFILSIFSWIVSLFPWGSSSG